MKFEIMGFKKHVEIEDYRASAFEGSKIANFSVVIYPEGEKIIDCKYLQGKDGPWWCFPAKNLSLKDGKQDYIPYVSYKDKAYLEQLKIAVLSALQNHSKEPDNAKKSNPQAPGPNAIQSEPSLLW